MSNKAYSSYTIVDVVDGLNWLGDLKAEPESSDTYTPKLSDAYYNTTTKKSYIFDGEKWVVFAKDGTDGIPGTPGAPGADGDEVSEEYIQYYIQKQGTLSPTVDSDWMDDFPGWDGDGYVWQRAKKIWTKQTADGSVKITYSAPHKMSVLEAATLAAEYDELTLADWCVEYNTSIIDGSTIASGSITAKQLSVDAIQSNNYDSGVDDSLIPSDNFSVSGSYFNLEDGGFYTPTFAVDTDGNAYFGGELTAPSGTIGGFTIEDTKIYTNYKSSLDNSMQQGVYIGTDGISLSGMMQVDANLIGYYPYVMLDAANGKLFSNNAEISGKITAKEGYIGTATKGFSIDDSAIYNVLTINGEQSHMVSPNSLVYPTVAPELGGKSYDYVYVGTDGIGTTDVRYASDGTSEITAQTHMYNGKLFSNSGEIGGWKISSDGLTSTNNSSGVIISGGADSSTTIENGIITNRSIVENGNYALYNSNELNAGELSFTRYNTNLISKATIGWNLDSEFYDEQTDTYAMPFQINARDIIIGDFKDPETATPTTGELRGKLWTIYADDTKGSGGFGTKINSSLQIANKLSVVGGTTTLTPASNNNYTLGSSSYKWKDIYASTATINTSDRNEKNSILEIDTRYEIMFDALNGRLFKFNQNDSNRTHAGFIAQDVEAALIDAGLTTADFAGICIWDNDDGSQGYGLRYDEFIALNTWQIQKLKHYIKTLEERILQLENKQ